MKPPQTDVLPSGGAACPVTVRDALILMAADMLMTGEMPPDDPSDWGVSKATTLRDKMKGRKIN